MSLNEFSNKGEKAVIKIGKKQILITKFLDKLFAIDNRCPHEGYPLSEGTVDSQTCVLTCNWHNWKFDLKTGNCIDGGDHVTAYPIKEENEHIYVDASDPDIEVIQKKILEGLQVAFEKNQYGRMAREITKLSLHKIDPLVAIKKGIDWSYDRFEYGTNHSYAALADWLTLYDECQEDKNHNDKIENQIICLTEGMNYLSYASLRHPAYPYPDRSISFKKADFLQAIEDEDQNKATSLLLGALQEKTTINKLEEIFTEIALAHYNDFGHSLIYTQKSFQLIRRFNDDDISKKLLLALTRSIVYATREDLIPEFKDYRPTLDSLSSSDEHDLKNEHLTLDSYLMGKNVKESLKITKSLMKNYKHKTIFHFLLLQNTHNFLNYDLKFQEATHNPVSQNTGWLSFTHALTFSHAVHDLCTKYPQFWKQGLLQMASFFGRNYKFTQRNNPISHEDYKIDDVPSFKKTIKEKIFDHGLSLPIFSAHILKTSVAILEEFTNSDHPEKDLLLSSLNRFLQSPLKAKHVRRTVYQAIKLVEKDF